MAKVTITVPDGVAKFLKKRKLTKKEDMISTALFFYPFVYDQKLTTKEVADFMGLTKENVRDIYRCYEVDGRHSSVLDDVDFLERMYS